MPLSRAMAMTSGAEIPMFCMVRERQWPPSRSVRGVPSSRRATRSDVERIPDKKEVAAGDGEDLADGVDKRGLLADNASEHQAAEEEDEDELDGGELLAGPAADNAHDEDEKEVADEGAEHGPES